MKKNIIIILLIILNIPLYPNGMAVDGSAIYRTGNIYSVKKPDIILEQEILSIVINNDSTNVTVKYYFRNTGKSDTIDYIFPVDYYITREFLESEFPRYDYTDQVNPFIKNIQIIEDGIERKFSEIIKNDKKNNNHQIATTWFKDKFIFPVNNTKEFVISYTVVNDFQDYVFTSDIFDRYSKREFRYRLKPSSCWGNGVVKQFNCTIDLNQIINQGGKILNIKLPIQTDTNSAKMNIDISEFDLSSSSDINIQYDLSNYYKTKDILDNNITKRSIKSISTSSCLNSNYSSNNLIDQNMSTAWVEGKNDSGIGETISIEFNEANILGVLLINGYMKNKKIFEANNRLKKVRIDYTYKFMYDLKSPVKENSIILNIPNRSFNKYSSKIFAPFSNLLTQYSDAYLRIYNMKITILDVYPGDKYNDTCISEIIVFGHE